MSPWIQTYTDRKFPLFEPTVDDIVIDDVAHALSLQCRFVGHVKKFYSVAEHSVRVSLVVPAKDALWGLLHDSVEAYISDMSRPLKRSIVGAEFIKAENKIMRVVCHKFGLPETMPYAVHHFDRVLGRTEQRDLLGPLPEEWDSEDIAAPLPEKIVPWNSSLAEHLFLMRFRKLTGGEGV